MGTDIAIDIAARISGATTDVAGRVTGAIRDAARQTGAGFEYLLNTALRESNLNPNAKAKTSSATGLFQFIDQTWLGTLKQSGASLGYGKYADAISRTAQGRYVVNDPTMRQEIFALRKDPTANAVMAGAFANSNSKVLTERLGRKPTDGELYIAHFLGASGAARFISAAEAQPDAKAATFFPRAAAANSSIFYDKQGGAKSLRQVYAGLIAKHDVIGTSRFAAANPQTVKAATTAQSVESAKPATQAIESAKPATQAVESTKPATQAVAARTETANPLAFFRDVSAKAEVTPSTSVTTSQAATTVAPMKAVTPVQSVSATSAMPTTTETAPQAMALAAEQKPRGQMFQTLFHEDERGAVAPVVRELWGGRRVAAAETPVAATAAPATSSTIASAPAAPAASGAVMSATAAPAASGSVTSAAATPAAVVSAGHSAAAEGARLNAPLDLFRFLRPTARS